MIAQKSQARRAVGVVAAGLAIVAVVAIALVPTPGLRPARKRLTFAIAPGSNSRSRQDVAKTMAALGQLKPPGQPLVVHLYADYTGQAAWGYHALLSQTVRTFERRGFDVEMAVRYTPVRSHDVLRSVRGFAALVRRIVTTFGQNRRFVSVQVTNEADLRATANSDGYFNYGDAAWQALIAGAMAAKETARAHHFDQLRVGFNYAADNPAFWRYLGRHGGSSFARALDWIGVDTYAGTLTPLPVRGVRRGVAEAIRREVERARRTYLPLARIPERVALHFSENGYATGNGHSYAMQVTALEAAVETVASLSRGSNVTEYDWFELRDASGSGGRPEGQLGLLTHDYRPKPAFSAYRRLIQELG